MSKTLSVAEAKAHFSECIRTAEDGDSVLITRHGKPIVALVRAADLEQLERLRAAGPQAGLAGLAGGWEGSDEFVTILRNSPRTGSRDVPDLD
jgi:prevent-host-death family protein